jgi:hypothetical protein
MQINNISNTSFQGSFLIKKTSQKSGKEILNLAKDSTKISGKIEKNSKLLITTRDKLDNNIKDYLNEKNIEFDFIPEINVKPRDCYITNVEELDILLVNSGFINEQRKKSPKIELASSIRKNFLRKNKSKISTFEVAKDNQLLTQENKQAVNVASKTKQENKNLSKPSSTAKKVTNIKYDIKPIHKSEDYVKNIAAAYELDFNRPVKDIRGVKIIEIAKNHTKIMISKPDQKGHHYIMIKASNSPNNRLVMNSEGKYLYSMNSNEDAVIFDRKFQELLEPKS